MIDIDTDDYREFADLHLLIAGATLQDDVAWFALCLTRAGLEARQEAPLGVALNADDPMASLRGFAGALLVVNAELRAQGFIPPTIRYQEDPLGFLDENAAFLRRVQHLVQETRSIQ
jgi:hypothetical protein